ncbi:MAG TPA: tRNA pseudouridine(55) synthase TruB [Candidatus Saccharimonadales bacterium]|nr:tRNA pseudouridine(55) synthase TruB [Candidatus Saccharimonadales bacterium]
MNGILLVDKPHGWTSFDVVNYVRKMVAASEGKKPKNTKVGHTGTLDPMATGLLVLLIGKDYTRRAGEFSKLDKTYEVVARLGQTSTTGDEEGGKTAVSDTVPSEEAIREALEQFRGEISQVPPQYSAIKINGQRAYDLARKGKIAEIEPRTVRIDRIELTKYQYPDVHFVCDVSSGTYIRSLVEDIGQALGTGAYTTALRRTRVGELRIADAVTIDRVTSEPLTSLLLQD